MLARRLLVCQRPRLVIAATISSSSPLHRQVRPRFSSTETKGTTGSSAPPPPKTDQISPDSGPGSYKDLVSLAASLCLCFGTGWFLNGWFKGSEGKSPIPIGSDLIELQTPDLNKQGFSTEIAYTRPPTPEEVTAQLNEHAFTVRDALGGSVHYSGAQLASNSPCEDAFLHGRFQNPMIAKTSSGPPSTEWMAWAVFDGHCGWQLSSLLTTQLMPHVRQALQRADYTGDNWVHHALKDAFTSLDDALVKSARSTIDDNTLSFAEKIRRLEPAYAGACALLALFNPEERKLTVASTGDCRAVLGQQKSAGSGWESQDLSQDCTGATPSEVERIKSTFPDEPDIVAGGRIWGMQPSRTLGDGMWKWSASLKKELRDSFNGLSLPSAARYKNYKEGPYITAEPLVTTTEIPNDRPSFVILATDGLWDAMSSEQAVDLVGRWWEQQRLQPYGMTTTTSVTSSGSSGSDGKDEKKAGGGGGDFGPVVLGWKQACRYEEHKATFRDKNNAAVHLMRNALGGADDEMVRGALTIRYPNSREVRDDITVQIVFFGR